MSTPEESAATAATRQLARKLLVLLDRTVQQLGPSMDLNARLELGAWVCEGRRLLHGDEAAPAGTVAPPNVRLVAFGKIGPAFGARGGVEVAIGHGGLRSGALDVPRSTADEFAAAHDLPSEGPGAA